jgi:hypothetical protein
MIKFLIKKNFYLFFLGNLPMQNSYFDYRIFDSVNRPLAYYVIEAKSGAPRTLTSISTARVQLKDLGFNNS